MVSETCHQSEMILVVDGGYVVGVGDQRQSSEHVIDSG